MSTGPMIERIDRLPVTAARLSRVARRLQRHTHAGAGGGASLLYTVRNLASQSLPWDGSTEIDITGVSYTFDALPNGGLVRITVMGQFIHDGDDTSNDAILLYCDGDIIGVLNVGSRPASTPYLSSFHGIVTACVGGASATVPLAGAETFLEGVAVAGSIYYQYRYVADGGTSIPSSVFTLKYRGGSGGPVTPSVEIQSLMIEYVSPP